MEPGVILVPPTVPVEPGGTGTAQVRVRNTGQVVEEFRLELIGPVAAWAVVEPALLRLFPGDEGEATVRFQPPRDATVGAGAATFGVRATPVAEPASAIVEEGTITVGGFSAISADISPRNVDGNSATHTITVRNAGNAPTTVGLSYVDPDERTAGSLQPAELQVAGGDAATATLKVAPKGGKRKAAARLGYQVHVRPADGGIPVTLDASLTRAGKRRKTPLIAAVIILLVGLIAFVALRPKVESAAVEIKEVQAQLAAAKSSVEEAQEQIAAAKQAAAAGGAAAGAAAAAAGNATTTTQTTELPATTVAPGDTTPTTVAATGGGAVEATTTTQTPEVAAGLTGKEAFGTVEQPKITCVGGPSRSGGSSTSTTTGRSSTTSSTSTST